MSKLGQHTYGAQLKFKALSGWGGKRRGAGRPNKSGHVSHMRRAVVTGKKPVHVTFKIKNKKWNLRSAQVANVFMLGSERAREFGLSILHYSILRDHIHLIVEAESNADLARGMKSLCGRLGRAIRKAVGGVGSVFAGRYHLVVIRNPVQMRNTLAYVLQNYSRHARLLPHLDAFSSAGYFSRWKELMGAKRGPILDRHKVTSRLPRHLSSPQSCLAREGWRRAVFAIT